MVIRQLLFENKTVCLYIKALEKAQLGGSKDDYYKLIAKAVDRSLYIYLKASKGKMREALKTGCFAKNWRVG